MNRNMTAVFVPWELANPMILVQIDGLRDMQKRVGGYVERVSTHRLAHVPEIFTKQKHFARYPLNISIDEEGLSKGYSHNLRAEYLTGYEGHTGLCGNALILSEGFVDDGLDYISLNTEIAEAIVMADEKITQLIIDKLHPRWLEAGYVSPVPLILELEFPPPGL